MTSIPVYSIIVRYNLLETGYVNKAVAFIASVIVPWILIVPFYTGTPSYLSSSVRSSDSS